MQILKVEIDNFRSIKRLEFFPEKHNVFIGPNNVGKTAIVEAINLCLNPEFSFRAEAIDENDFFFRQYILRQKSAEGNEETISHPKIKIDVILGPIENDEDLVDFRTQLVPWNANTRTIVQGTDEAEDPFAGNLNAIRICFEAQYDPMEDEFAWSTFFKLNDTDTWTPNAEINPKPVNKETKRRIGFLIYRDVRALQRPVTLEPSSLLTRVAKSQDATPQNFEKAFDATTGSLAVLSTANNFGRVLAELKLEINQFLQHGFDVGSKLKFELTDRTRNQFKAAAQLHIDDDLSLPSHKYGAGTRSLITLSLLTYVMRKRGRGILALEEPETFLYPHAQRRVINEALKISNQLFVTTHSPYILEQFSPASLGRVFKDNDGNVEIKYLKNDNAKFFKRNIRKQLAEALLSRAVVLTEEDSMAKWLAAMSELLHETIVDGVSIERFDLAGVSAISADGNGSLLPLASFIETAGLPVVICVDRNKTNESFSKWKTDMKPYFEIDYAGLEKLLVAEISLPLLRSFVTTTEVELTQRPTFEHNENEASQKKKILECLIQNKGSMPFQEWMIAQITTDSIPLSMRNIVKLVSGLLPKAPPEVDEVPGV